MSWFPSKYRVTFTRRETETLVQSDGSAVQQEPSTSSPEVCIPDPINATASPAPCQEHHQDNAPFKGHWTNPALSLPVLWRRSFLIKQAGFYLAKWELSYTPSRIFFPLWGLFSWEDLKDFPEMISCWYNLDCYFPWRGSNSSENGALSFLYTWHCFKSRMISDCGYCYSVLVMPGTAGEGNTGVWKGAEVLLMSRSTALGARPAQTVGTGLRAGGASVGLPPPACQHTDPLGLEIWKFRNCGAWIDPESGKGATTSGCWQSLSCLPHPFPPSHFTAAHSQPQPIHLVGRTVKWTHHSTYPEWTSAGNV